MRRWSTSMAASLLSAGLMLCASAQAAEPQVSVPSTPDAAGQVTIKGSAIAALSNVTVRFAHAQAAPVDMVTQTNASGSFAVKFQPLIVGAYSVTVYDARGQLIGQGRFSHIR